MGCSVKSVGLDLWSKISEMSERRDGSVGRVRTPTEIYDEIESMYGIKAREMALTLVQGFSKGISQKGDLPEVVRYLMQESWSGRIVVDQHSGYFGYRTSENEIRYLGLDATWFGFGSPIDPLTGLIVDLAKSVHEHGGHKKLKTRVVLGVLKNVSRIIRPSEDY